ncbi:uncharacterized protein BDV17DRAFT_277772 [Aspergillus undulatus]|uniref:uncharacterized protein n=1 Tax=Aspergillus undulatus TaxID=1810928 RepID=UPI003CCCC65B
MNYTRLGYSHVILISCIAPLQAYRYCPQSKRLACKFTSVALILYFIKQGSVIHGSDNRLPAIRYASTT